MRLDGFFAGEFLERTEAWQFELQTGSWLNVGLYIPIVLLFYPYEGSVFPLLLTGILAISFTYGFLFHVEVMCLCFRIF